MYAIVEIAGKQFRVSKDMKVKVPRLSTEPGKKVGFDKVMFIEDDKGNTTIGNPLVNNMLVNATVIEHGREKKVIVFKKKRRKGFQKSQGHRQGYSLIEINTIGSGTLKKETAAKPKTETVKPTAKPEAKEAVKSKAAPKTAAKPAAKKTPAKSTITKKKTAGVKTTATKTAAKKPAPKKKTKEE